MATVEETIYDCLMDDSELTSWVMRNIYQGFRSQQSVLPCVTILRISTVPTNGAGGASGTEHIMVQIDCWAEKYSTCRKIAEAVKTALDSLTNSSSPAISQILCTTERDLSELPEEGEGVAEYRIEQDWSVWQTT